MVRRGLLKFLRLGACVGLVVGVSSCAWVSSVVKGKRGKNDPGSDLPPVVTPVDNGEKVETPPKDPNELSVEDRSHAQATVMRVLRPFSSAAHSFRRSEQRWPSTWSELKVDQPQLAGTVEGENIKEVAFTDSPTDGSLMIKFTVPSRSEGRRVPVSMHVRR